MYQSNINYQFRIFINFADARILDQFGSDFVIFFVIISALPSNAKELRDILINLVS